MKRFFEKIKKFKLYFDRSNSGYVIYKGTQEPIYFRENPITYFPLDYQSTLGGPLFERFDEDGLPLKYFEGNYIYFHTKIFTYALAHWNRLLETGDEKSKEVVLQVSQYILDNTVLEGNDALLFREYIHGKGFSGGYSGAMEQGLGAFILSSAYMLTNNGIFLEAAEKCINPLISDEDRGISVLWANRTWFEEFPETGKHVLNGCLDALIGIWAVSQITTNTNIRKCFDSSVADLESQVLRFDRGWWSNYWVADGAFNYISSMKYHTIHIYQLQFLSEKSRSTELERISKKFQAYSDNYFFRIMALLSIAQYKIRMSINR